MTYEKPKVLVAASATEAIEHNPLDKPSSVALDSSTQTKIDTVNAYEADE